MPAPDNLDLFMITSSHLLIDFVLERSFVLFAVNVNVPFPVLDNPLNVTVVSWL